MNKREWIYIAVIAVFISWNYYTFTHKPTIPGEGFHDAGTITQPTGTVKCPDTGLQVIDPKDLKHGFVKKPTIIEKIVYRDVVVDKYPDWFDPKKIKILADAEIPAWTEETYVLSTVDITTGKGGITYKQLPRPPIGYPNEAKIGVSYILAGDFSGKLMLTGSYTPLRFGNWYFSGFGQSIDVYKFAGATAEYRW